MTPDYVAFGTGVDPSSRPGQIPFSKFTFGTVIPCTAPGACTGNADFVQPSITSGVTGQTLAQLTSLLNARNVDVLTAHFAALASSGTVVDRMSYQMETLRVVSVAIDTSPTGALQDTMGLLFGTTGQITWTAQSLAGGDDVSRTWSPFDPRQ